MRPDDTVCYCYHVSMRKLVNFALRTQPARPSRMSECLSAGTGCGWCIPILIRIARDPDRFAASASEIVAEEYAAARARYLKGDGPRNRFDAT